jgi:hypothetical protein
MRTDSDGRWGWLRALLLLIADDRLRYGFAHFKLGTHLLDLRRLLFETRSEGLYFFLLLRDSRLEVLLLLRDRRF